MTSALSRSDTRTKNRSLQIANDALYPSYGESWRDEIYDGPEDPEPGDAVFGEEEDGQLFFDFVRQLQINPDIAKGYRFKGDPLIKDEDRYDLTGPAIQGPRTLGEHNMRLKLRQILQGGVPPQAQVTPDKLGLTISSLDPAALKALKDASKPGLSSKEIRAILKPFTKPDQFGHPSGSMKII